MINIQWVQRTFMQSMTAKYAHEKCSKFQNKKGEFTLICGKRRKG